MPPAAHIPQPLLQTKMARFEPLKINYGNYVIHVISDPHTLPSRIKNKIIRHFQKITQNAFGRQKPADVSEVAPRTVGPDLSLLLLVVHRKSKKFVGYFSTRVLNNDTIHLHASVFDGPHQNKGCYAVTKQLAQVLEQQKMQLHGKKALYISAQSPFPEVLAKLAEHDGLLPAPISAKNRRELNQQAQRLAQALGESVPYEKTSGIRTAALGFNASTGVRLQSLGASKTFSQNTIEKALNKISTPNVRRKLRRVFQHMKPEQGDTVLTLRKLDGKYEQLIRQTADPLIHRHLQPMVLAELLLGRHRKYFGEIRTRLDIRGIHFPHVMSPVLEINVRPQNLDLVGLSKGIQEEIQHNTAFGKAWKENETEHPTFRALGPTMFIPIGPIVESFFKILRQNLVNPKKKSKP